MKAMILAAGYGTRLRPVTYSMPKPMAPVCNRPLIAWAVDSVLAAGVDEIVVNLHHLPVELETYLRGEFASKATLHFSYEEEILGTGGGIRNVRHLLEEGEEFLLVNGDTVQFPPWQKLLEARRASDSIAALTLRHPPEGDRFTPVYFHEGRVTGFGKGEGEPLMFAGSHVISTRIFQHLPDRPFSGIVEHAYQPLLDAKRETIAGVVDDGLWFDIGTPKRYLAAAAALREAIVGGALPVAPGSRVDDESIVHETSDGKVVRSSLGARSIVNGEVSDSVVWDECFLGEGVTLERCIVAHRTRIETGSYRDALIVPDHEAIPAEVERAGGLVVTPIP
jgi:mannose-1-phosphate guanylyltransferase